MIKQNIESAGGKVICTVNKEKGADKPTIQYQETNWEFAQRLASYLGTFLIPDIETGKTNFWIDMKQGESIPTFLVASYLWITWKHTARISYESWCMAKVEKCRIWIWIGSMDKGNA